MQIAVVCRRWVSWLLCLAIKTLEKQERSKNVMSYHALCTLSVHLAWVNNEANVAHVLSGRRKKKGGRGGENLPQTGSRKRCVKKFDAGYGILIGGVIWTSQFSRVQKMQRETCTNLRLCGVMSKNNLGIRWLIV